MQVREISGIFTQVRAHHVFTVKMSKQNLHDLVVICRSAAGSTSGSWTREGIYSKGVAVPAPIYDTVYVLQ